MKILITGAAGFLGKSLVRQLIGTHELYCLTRKVGQGLPDGENIHWIDMDLSGGLDETRLPKELDAIIHLAQSNGYRNFPQEANDVFAVNVALAQQLCDFGWRSGISNMILASTGTVYEPFLGSMREDEEVRPTGYYGASKLSAELISEAYSSHFSVCNLRVFFLYGPGQENMLIARLIDSVKSGKRVTLPKDREGLVFVPTFVEDTASVFKTAVEQGWQGVYNVASPHETSLGGLLRTISDATGKPLNLEVTDGDTPSPIVPNLEKIAAKFDLSTFHDPQAGIAKSI